MAIFASMNLPNFYMEVVLFVFFEKIILYAGKILVWRNFGHYPTGRGVFCAPGVLGGAILAPPIFLRVEILVVNFWH